jgi:hypothetical protein
MIRWLQTSLFGRPADTEASLKAPAPRLPAPSTKPLDPALAARWKSARADLAIDLIVVPRLRQGWRLEWKRGLLTSGHGPRGSLRVPKTFLDASDATLAALAAWARLAMQRKSPARRKERIALEKLLHGWIEARHGEDEHVRKLTRRRAARRVARLNPAGEHHDLTAIFGAINAEYFGGALEAKITWSRRWGGLSTQTTAHDAAGKPYALLTISRGYDHKSATPEIVGGVVYHECLHIAVPPQEVTETSANRGRRVVHGREFRRREKEYRFYEEWRKWHAEKLPGIVRRGK